MSVCPNCGKNLNSDFSYCWECGCNLEGGGPGDYSTSHLNVFREDEEYIYIYAVHGKQIVLRASSIAELKILVHMNKFPWMDLDN